MPVVEQDRNRAAGIHPQQRRSEGLVRAGLDQVDVVAHVVDLELGEADPGLHRAERERVVIELPLRFMGEVEVGLEAGRDGMGPPPASFEEEPANGPDHEPCGRVASHPSSPPWNDPTGAYESRSVPA